MQVPYPARPLTYPNPECPTLVAASLDLKAEKQDAHNGRISSVAYSRDGKTIVSGGMDDQALKVWDAGVSALTPPTP